MTFVCVPIVVDEFHSALAAAELAVKLGARLLEWRVDRVAREPDLVERLVRDSPLPCIVTCRPTSEGGEFDGDETDRIRLFERIGIHARPRYIDIEHATLERSPVMRQRLALAIAHPDQHREMDSKLIVSAHDFSGRPTDLYQRIERMAADPDATALKVAWRARSIRDNLEAFEILRHRPKPMIALLMGEFGQMSRILAAKFGGFMTFVALDAESKTAPGQLTIDELKSIYNFERINEATQVYGVIGWPIAHSLSPRLHNAAFSEIEFDGVYVPMPAPPGYESFKATVGAMLDYAPLDFRGASVTSPHKENLVRFVREEGGRISETAAEVGAANTLLRREDGTIEAHNTDALALVESICEALSIGREALAELRIAIIGAGGMARAAVAALSRFDATVVICNRTLERAEALANEFRGQPSISGIERQVIATPMANLCKSCAHVFINTTPVGMSGGARGGPAESASLIPLDAEARPAWNESTLVFDTVYAPRRTPLLAAAAASGARTLNGLDMFVRQAADQFQLWTGKRIELALLRNIVESTDEIGP